MDKTAKDAQGASSSQVQNATVKEPLQNLMKRFLLSSNTPKQQNDILKSNPELLQAVIMRWPQCSQPIAMPRKILRYKPYFRNNVQGVKAKTGNQQQLQEDNDANGESELVAELTVTRAGVPGCINSYVHANQCRQLNCPLPNCPTMKRVVRHMKTCQIHTSGGCKICKQLVVISCFHSRECQVNPCVIPFCFNIKQKIRESIPELHIPTQTTSESDDDPGEETLEPVELYMEIYGIGS